MIHTFDGSQTLQEAVNNLCGHGHIEQHTLDLSQHPI